jgi:ribosome-associated protein
MTGSSSPPRPERLPAHAIEERFVRASGPGGQHVNKAATAVQLRFDTRLAAYPEAVTQRLLRLAGTRADSEGVITIFAQRYRSQERNREDARHRLATLVGRAMEAPRPRVPTRVPHSARRKRLDEKRRTGMAKARRGKPSIDD